MFGNLANLFGSRGRVPQGYQQGDGLGGFQAGGNFAPSAPPLLPSFNAPQQMSPQPFYNMGTGNGPSAPMGKGFGGQPVQGAPAAGGNGIGYGSNVQQPGNGGSGPGGFGGQGKGMY